MSFTKFYTQAIDSFMLDTKPYKGRGNMLDRDIVLSSNFSHVITFTFGLVPLRNVLTIPPAVG